MKTIAIIMTIAVLAIADSLLAQENTWEGGKEELKKAINYDEIAKKASNYVAGFDIKLEDMKSLQDFEIKDRSESYHFLEGVQVVVNMRSKNGPGGVSLRIFIGSRGASDAHSMMLFQMAAISAPIEVLCKNLKVLQDAPGDFCIVFKRGDREVEEVYLARANVAVIIRSHSDSLRPNLMTIAEELDKKLLEEKHSSVIESHKNFPNIEAQIPVLQVGAKTEVKLTMSRRIAKGFKLVLMPKHGLLTALLDDENNPTCMYLTGLKEGKDILAIGIFDANTLNSKWALFDVKIVSELENDDNNSTSNSQNQKTETEDPKKLRKKPEEEKSSQAEDANKGTDQDPTPGAKEEKPLPPGKEPKHEQELGQQQTGSANKLLIIGLIVLGAVVAGLVIFLLLRRKK